MGLVWCVAEALGTGWLGIASTLFANNGSIKALAVLGSLFLVQIYMTASLSKSVAVVRPSVSV